MRDRQLSELMLTGVLGANLHLSAFYLRSAVKMS